MTSVTIDDFNNLFKPGELPDLGAIVDGALATVTTATMLSIPDAKIKGIGTSLIAIRNAAISNSLAVPGNKFEADIKTITDTYATIPAYITAYVKPTDPTLIAAAAATGPDASLGINTPPYDNIISYIKKTIHDFDSSLLFEIVQANGSKTDVPTMNALTSLIQAYITYLNSIIAVFNLDNGTLDKSYYQIVGSIEAILNKMDITVPAKTTTDSTALVPLVEPLAAVPLVAPLKPMPSGRIIYNTNSGFGPTYPEFSTHFPNGNSVILQKGPLVLPAGSNQWVAGPWAERPPPVGSVITNLPWMQPNTKVVSVTDGYPLADAGLYNPVGATGYLVKFDPPMSPDYQYPNGEQRGNRWAVIFTYPPIPEEVQAANDFPATLAAWGVANRTTPDPMITEIGKSINASIAAIIRNNTLPSINNPKVIAAIKYIPTTIKNLITYIKSNSVFYKKIGVNDFINSQLAPFYPIPPATQDLFDKLTKDNFVASLTTAPGAILPYLTSNFTANFSLNVLKKPINKTPTSGGQKDIGSSIGTKTFQLYFEFLNSLINIFNIKLLDDKILVNHINKINSTFANAGFGLVTTPQMAGGRPRIARSRNRKNRRKGTRRR